MSKRSTSADAAGAPATNASTIMIPSKRLIIPASQKGGVGKSWMSVQLADWLLTHALRPRVALFDPDQWNKTLQSHFPKHTKMIERASDEEGAMDICFDVLAQKDNPADISLVDGVGAQHGKIFAPWLKEAEILKNAASIGCSITYLLSLENDEEGIEHANSLVATTSESVEWIVFLNRKIDHNLPNVEKSVAYEILRQKAEAGTAAVHHIEKFPTKLKTLMSNDRRSIGEAQRNPEDYSLLDRSRYNTQVETYSKMFESMRHLILPKSFLTA